MNDVLWLIPTFLLMLLILVQIWLDRRIKREQILLMMVISHVESLSIEDAHNKIDFRWRWKALRGGIFKPVVFSRKPITESSYWDDLSFMQPGIKLTHTKSN